MSEFSCVDLPLDVEGGELRLVDDGALVRRSILPGGVRVLTERVPHARTASVGMWVGAGSADEGVDRLGSTHFLEHLLFKGTRGRSAQQIAERIDYLGGTVNAATGKQVTYYYGQLVEEDLPGAVDLLADMVAASRLAEADMELERGVILEELAMYDDDAGEVAHERIAALVFGPHPLGRPIGGTRESVSGLAHSSLTAHYRDAYRPRELVVAAAGAVDHDVLCSLVLGSLARAGWDCADGAPPAPRRRRADIVYGAPQDAAIGRSVEQAAVIVAMPAITDEDPRRYALFALNSILGGGTSSRLFQEVRDKRGLAYSTYSFPGLYHEGGLFGMYAGCSPADAANVTALMEECLEAMAGGGVGSAEVETAYRRVRADVAFGAESMGSRMSALGRAELVRGSLVSREESIRRARAVTAEDVADLAADLARAPRSRIVVGPEAAFSR